MGKLESTLPKIVKQALHDEDDATRDLVNVLLNQIYHGKSQSRTAVAKTLDDEIEKLVEIGKIDIRNF